MATPIAYYFLAFLLSACFTLGVVLQPRSSTWSSRAETDNTLKLLFGEGRRLFADQFFRQADVYFHSGYYPSIFDQAAKAKAKDTSHLMESADSHEAEGHDEHADKEESEHYKQMALARPRDWVEAFGRHFTVTAHTHLTAGGEREMLPWLRLSAEMDPQRIDTYTVAAYWLKNLGKNKEAENFLRMGLRNNPDNYDLLYELGLLMQDVKHDDERARNLWRTALTKWLAQEQGKQEPDSNAFDRIAVRLAKLEERQGHPELAAEYLKLSLKFTRHEETIRHLLDEVTTAKP